MRHPSLPLLLCAGACLFLSACKAGPDYRPPETGISVAPAAKGAFLSARHDAFTQADLPARWWSLYNNPQLDSLIEQVLAANADLRAAGANIDNAEAVIRQSDAGRKLETRIDAAGTLLKAENDGEPFPGKMHHGLSLSATYALDLAGKIKRGIEADFADREVALAARDAVRTSLVVATVRAYTQICAANYAADVHHKIEAVQLQTVSTVRKLKQGGRSTAFDVSRAQAQADASAAALPGYIAQRKAGLYMLAALMGKAPAEYPHDIENCATLPELSHPMPVGDGSALILRRPDIRAAERKIAGDTARIGVAMADLYPQVELFGGLGRLNVVGGTIGETARAFSLGPMISWSFPRRHLVEARIDAAEAKVRTDIALYDSAIVQALREAETAMEAYAQGRQTTTSLAAARRSATIAAQQAGRLFRYGRGDILGLLVAQKSAAEAQAAEAEARIQLVEAQILVFETLGGGWETPKASPQNSTKPPQAAGT